MVRAELLGLLGGGNFYFFCVFCCLISLVHDMVLPTFVVNLARTVLHTWHFLLASFNTLRSEYHKATFCESLHVFIGNEKRFLERTPIVHARNRSRLEVLVPQLLGFLDLLSSCLVGSTQRVQAFFEAL